MRTEKLRELVGRTGPFVSVYIDVSHDTEDAATRNETRWRAVETELAADGADQDTVDAAREAVLGQPAVGRAGRAVIAAHGAVLVNEDLPIPPSADLARVSDLPYLLPLLSALEPPIPHVIVLADKTGATLRGVDANGAVTDETVVHGGDQPAHHGPGGGRAHGSTENRDDETARRNARQIAEHTARLVERVGADLVVLAGTISPRSAVHAELPAHVRKLSVELDVDAAHTALDAEDVTEGVARMLAQSHAERDQALLERLHIGLAHDTACEGLAKVTEALRSGAVDTVLVTDPSLGDRMVWVGADPSQVAVEPAVLREMGSEVTEHRADEAVAMAALGTSAEVVVLTGAATLTDGVAALLRY
jgi:peptide subunit release factor 1 (eRF1)